MAVASAGPYASMHLAPDRQTTPAPHHCFFTGRMPFLPPNQQHQSTEGNIHALDKQINISHTQMQYCVHTADDASNVM